MRSLRGNFPYRYLFIVAGCGFILTIYHSSSPSLEDIIQNVKIVADQKDSFKEWLKNENTANLQHSFRNTFINSNANLGEFEPQATEQSMLDEGISDLIPAGNSIKSDIESLLDKQNLVTSGKIFKGEKIREYPKNEIKFKGLTAGVLSENDKSILNEFQKQNKYGCEKWGVVTTIFEPPSEAVTRFMYRNDWCVVVVGDKGKPSKVNDSSIFSINNITKCMYKNRCLTQSYIHSSITN